MIYTLTLNPALDRELTVPELAFDQVLRASTLRIDYGGKGFNVSRALAALGQESVALGFVGGLTGQRIADGLAEPPKIEERNPIGAGDSAVAGLVWGLSQQLSWPEILRWSMACGAATASRAGTAVGSKAQVESLTSQVRLTTL
jgi:fructose-1-phosphate kinase PfkB-like protein